MRTYPGSLADLKHVVAEAMAVLQEKQGFSHDLPQTHFSVVAPGQGMPRGNDEQHGFPDEALGRQGSPGDGQAQQRQVQFSLNQLVDKRAGEILPDSDVNVGANNLVISGNKGSFNILANITASSIAIPNQCSVAVSKGKELRIIGG